MIIQHDTIRRAPLAVLLAVLAALVLTACETNFGGAMRNTMTAHDAERRVEDYIQQAITALPPQRRLTKPFRDTYACDDPTDNGPKGRVIASVDYQIDGLPQHQYDQYLDALKKWWISHDFRVLEDARPKVSYIWVQNNTDSFRMAAKTNDRGEMYLVATSPCVWPNGTPDS
ncbi:MAG: hypothetical protein ACRDSM_22535 [Pseudonocardiaceae bacterium]